MRAKQADGWGAHVQASSLGPIFPTLLAYGELSLPMKGRERRTYFRTQPPPAGL